MDEKLFYRDAADRLLIWYDQNKRTMPWRGQTDAYYIWVSEIMLQQTRVDTVIPYYTRFLQRFPNVSALAAAPEEDVLKQWEGLGYYSRARNLHRAAKQVVAEHNGIVPRDEKALRKLSGVGDYTAGAILSIAYGLPVPAVDGNVLRVITRLTALAEDITKNVTKQTVRGIVQAMMPPRRCGDFTQSLMELGATVCTPGRPACAQCPWEGICKAHQTGREDLLPIKAAKAPVPDIARTVAIIVAEGRVLVRRRSEALLHGLWEFPGWEGDTPTVGEQLSAWGMQAQSIAPPIAHTHVFTHRRWVMQGYVVRAAQLQPLADEGYRWVSWEELDQLTIPTAMRPYLKAAKAALKVQKGMK